MNIINSEMAWKWTQAGDKAMAKKDYKLAVFIYTNAFSIDDLNGAKYLLPRISACYRRMSCPQSAISFYKQALSKYGEAILDRVVLTAIASVYGDLENWNAALNCANKAASLNDGVVDEYLENVYGRINYNLNSNNCLA